MGSEEKKVQEAKKEFPQSKDGIIDQSKQFDEYLIALKELNNTLKDNKGDETDPIEKRKFKTLISSVIVFLVFIVIVTSLFIFRFEKFDGIRTDAYTNTIVKPKGLRDSSNCICLCIKPCCVENLCCDAALDSTNNKKGNAIPVIFEIHNSSKVRLSGENAFIFLVVSFYLVVIALIIAFIFRFKYEAQSEKEKMDYDLKRIQESNKKAEFGANNIFDVKKYLNQYAIDFKKADIENRQKTQLLESENKNNEIDRKHKEAKNGHDENLWGLEEAHKAKENEIKQSEYDASNLEIFKSISTEIINIKEVIGEQAAQEFMKKLLDQLIEKNK